ncbi:HD domain-containing protein [Streptomyces sp. NPDC006450]|uniref:HD domain-containing protein n=1 Tax=Streptomyces sp. NPDC006450 TaxID=3155458 RepID=UPI0033A81441
MHVKLAKWAYDLAEALLAENLPDRWAHSQRVYSQALTLVPALGVDAELLAAAAIAHDVGYAKDAVDTGQHLTGATSSARPVPKSRSLYGSWRRSGRPRLCGSRARP